MNFNYLYLTHESFPPLHLDFSPSFLHSKKPKVQPLILWENILRGCLASKKMKMKEKEKQSKALYILYIFISILHTSLSISLPLLQWMQGDINREVFQPSQLRNLMIGGLQGEEWKFIQKYLKEKISRGVGKTEEISHHAWAGAKLEGVVRISHKPGAVGFRRPYLPHFSSKSYPV